MYLFGQNRLLHSMSFEFKRNKRIWIFEPYTITYKCYIVNGHSFLMYNTSIKLVYSKQTNKPYCERAYNLIDYDNDHTVLNITLDQNYKIDLRTRSLKCWYNQFT